MVGEGSFLAEALPRDSLERVCIVERGSGSGVEGGRERPKERGEEVMRE